MGCRRSPFLNMGTTLAVVQSDGIIPCFSEAWKNSVNVGVSSSASVLSSLVGMWSGPESGSIPLRNWIFLPIPSPIPELELNWNWLYPVQVELELNWNCHHLNWNWSRNCVLRNWIRNCLHGIEIRYEVPHISVAYYSRSLAQVVYTLLVHIDSTKEIRGQLCNCSHNKETVGSYQPFHDQIGHGLTITGQWCFLREAKSHQPCYIIPGWVAFFVWPAGWPSCP